MGYYAKKPLPHELPPIDLFYRNATELSGIFRLAETGYFGLSGKSSRRHIRQIVTVDHHRKAEDFFSLLSRGGVVSSGRNRQGKLYSVAAFADVIITFRSETSTPDSPAVEINIAVHGPVRSQKIHFEGTNQGRLL